MIPLHEEKIGEEMATFKISHENEEALNAAVKTDPSKIEELRAVEGRSFESMQRLALLLGKWIEANHEGGDEYELQFTNFPTPDGGKISLKDLPAEEVTSILTTSAKQAIELLNKNGIHLDDEDVK